MYVHEVLAVKRGGEIHSIAPEASVEEAVRRMVDLDIGSLVVLQDQDMVGLITERDILRGLRARGCALEGVRVGALMEHQPVIVAPDDSVDYARDVMTKSRISHVVVLDGKQLMGVISFHDVARACLKEANFENSLLKRYIRHWPE